MQIAIAGSGAMGCRFGVMFHENGHDVFLLDNWIEHIKTINEKGLEIVT
jgi:2-dehydropantoate 2-reductase